MFNSPLAIVAALALVLTGCASAPGNDNSLGASTTESEAVMRIAPAVSIPAASSKRVILTMSGPKHVLESGDWGKFKLEWRETFAEHAREAGVAFSFLDEPPTLGGEEGTVIHAEVADYRIVGIAARIWFGLMTGNAFIDAKLRFTNLRDGNIFGEQQYNTSSSAGGGVFAKVTPQQVDQIATNVFLDLRPPR